MDETTYKVIKFNQSGGNEVVHTDLTLEEAQEICNMEDTKAETWFYGYTEE